MKKKVIFHICALPQLYVNHNQSYLRLDPPPWKYFLDPRLNVLCIQLVILNFAPRGGAAHKFLKHFFSSLKTPENVVFDIEDRMERRRIIQCHTQ